jgi:hypothetical protein
MPYTFEASYIFRDREGNVGTSRVFFPFDGGNADGAYAKALAMYHALSAVSSAVITSFTVRASYEVSHSHLSAGGDITSVCVVVVRSVNDFHSVILVPAVSTFYMLRDNANMPLYVADRNNSDIIAFEQSLIQRSACDRWGFQLLEVMEIGWSQ